MASAWLNVEKRCGAGIVKKAAKHNLREIQAELGPDSRIDANRVHLNVILHGPETAADVDALASRLMKEAGIVKLRKDAVRALEIVIGIPPGVLADEAGFFCNALAWSRSFFGAPVLSAVVHRDEGAPHLQMLLLPLVGGAMVGSDLMGGPRRLQKMQADFYEAVAKRHGLGPAGGGGLTKAARRQAAAEILSRLQGNPDYLRDPYIGHMLLDVIERNPNPGPLMAALGVEATGVTPKRERSFAEIWAKPVKPEPATNPIGF